MNKTLKYSVLRYSPSTVAGEMINLGILFYEESIGYREFRYTRKLSRLQGFDDEADIPFVREWLRGLSEHISGDLFSQGAFDIDGFTRFYINDFQFEKPREIVYDDLESTIELLLKTYFRFDYNKEERTTKEDDKLLLERLIIAQGNRVRRNGRVSGSFDDSVKYDLITDDYDIKLFDFDGKNLKHSINTAKVWAWNCMHDKQGRTMLVYRYNGDSDSKYDTEFQMIMAILNDANAKVYSIEEGIEMLQRKKKSVS